MPVGVLLSDDAVRDIDAAVAYYNRASPGLGYIFADVIDHYFNRIRAVPTASAICYDSVRVKPVDTFPFTIHYTIINEERVVVLRVFNTHQQPHW